MNLNDWQPWQLVLLAGIGLTVLLLLILIALTTRRSRDDRHHLRDVEDELEEGFRALENALGQQSLSQREEQLRTLQTIGDSLAGLLNRGTEQQNNQLAAWQRNTMEQDRAQDGRTARMYQLTEESLAGLNSGCAALTLRWMRS